MKRKVPENPTQDIVTLQAGINQDIVTLQAGINQDIVTLQAGINQDIVTLQAGIRINQFRFAGELTYHDKFLQDNTI